MGDWLALKAKLEEGGIGGGVENQVAGQRRHKDGDEAQQQLAFPEQHRVPDAAHHAQTGALRQRAHNQTGCQRDENGGVLGAGAGLGECQQGGEKDQNDQDDHLNDGKRHALQSGLPVSTLQGIALVQEEHAGQNAAHKAQQAKQGVQIAARQPENHAEGTAQKCQTAYHDEKAQNKPGQRRGAALGRPFLFQAGHQEAAQNQTDNFGPDVLDDGGGVQLQTAGGVPQEAGNAEAHIGGIAEQHQQHGNDSDGQTGQNDGKFFVFQFHPIYLHLFFGSISVYHGRNWNGNSIY